MSQEKIAVASDHGGFQLKEDVINILKNGGYAVEDFGTKDNSSVNYPEFGAMVAKKVSSGEIGRAILICGTGIGMSIVANKFPNVRATLCHNLFTAKMSREHNNSNILILGERILNPVDAEGIVQTWLSTPFEGGRHQVRLDLISKIEKEIS